jgi:apolipoprotein N-acyltransferase
VLLAIAVSTLALALYTRVVWPWVLLGWVGFVPWLAALERARSLRGALWIAWLFSVAYVLAVFPWFASGIAAYTGIPTAIAFGLLALGAPLLQPQLLVYAAVRRLLRSDAG